MGKERGRGIKKHNRSKSYALNVRCTLQNGDGYFDIHNMVISVAYMLSRHLALNRGMYRMCGK